MPNQTSQLAEARIVAFSYGQPAHDRREADRHEVPATATRAISRAAHTSEGRLRSALLAGGGLISTTRGHYAVQLENSCAKRLDSYAFS